MDINMNQYNQHFPICVPLQPATSNMYINTNWNFKHLHQYYQHIKYNEHIQATNILNKANIFKYMRQYNQKVQTFASIQPAISNICINTIWKFNHLGQYDHLIKICTSIQTWAIIWPIRSRSITKHVDQYEKHAQTCASIGQAILGMCVGITVIFNCLPWFDLHVKACLTI